MRGLCAASVVAAVVSLFWSGWIALLLAGIGLGFGIPLWLGRSWRDILESTGSALRNLLRRAPAQPPPVAKKRQSERLPVLQGVVRRTQGEDPAGPEREVPKKAVKPIPRSSHTWTLPARGREPSTENRLCPQNGIRLAVDSVAAKQEKPIPPEGPREVINLQSVMKNLEKVHRGKESAERAPEREPKPARDPRVTIELEEIHRRLGAAYGLRMPGSDRRTSSRPPENKQGGDGAEPRDGGVAPPAATHIRFPVSSRPAGRAAEEGSRVERPVVKPVVRPEGNGDAPRFVPRENLSERVAEAAPPPVSGGAPVSGESHDWWDAGEAEDPVAPVLPGRSGGLRRSVESIEEDARAWLTAPPALDLEDGEPEWPVSGDRDNPFPSQFRDDVSLPPLSLLASADSAVAPMDQDELIEGGILIEEKLAEFRVKVLVQDAYAGPVITRYEVQPAVGVRGGQVVSLMKDLARALGVAAIRVVETIPGKTCMGLELPNPHRQMIRLSEVLSSEVFHAHPSKLAMALGKDIIGEPVVVDLARSPHMLVAGTTGSGKSVGVNAMILSLLYRATPDEVRFVMIDPKMLELSIYDGIPHLLAPVVTDMKLAANALNWCVGEMERRYRLMSGLQVRNLAGYNQKVRDAAGAGEPLLDPFSSTPDDPVPLAPLPYVVVVVDELADLMMVSGKKIEELIARLAQKARAAGIHLILATQRPSVDVITGLIKANIPTRIAFQVSSKIDSRTILDQMGAECLLGQGDMLYLPPGTGYPQRVHGAFVADEEVQAVAEHLKQFGEPQYVDGVLGGPTDAEETEPERFGEETEPLYDEAVAFVVNTRRASISAVQRHLRIGYNRAARMVEQMEAAGLVSAMESNGNRTVLVPARPE